MNNEQEILKLLKENNIMLKAILSKLSNNYNSDFKEFMINIAANLISDNRNIL